MKSIKLLPNLCELPGHDSVQPRSFREIITELTNAIPESEGPEGVQTSGPPFVRPYDLIRSTTDGLTVLSNRSGIPLPDSTLGIQPYTEDIIASLPLICHALENGNRFNEADRTGPNEGRIVRTLMLMARMGISTVLKSVNSSDNSAVKKIASETGKAASRTGGRSYKKGAKVASRTASKVAGEATKRGLMWGAAKVASKVTGKVAGKVIGAVAGGAAGSLVPGVGNAAVAAAGAVAGAAVGTVIDNFVGSMFNNHDSPNGLTEYLDRHLQPHMLDLALDITGLTNDDLFYYKNKPRIDTAALRFHRAARELAASPR